MRIHVLGSFKPEGEMGIKGGKTDFEAACRSLGHRIARLGHTLIVAGNMRLGDTADEFVYQGAKRACLAGETRGTILEYEPSTKEGFPDLQFARDHPDAIRLLPATERHWSAIHLKGLRRADAVLVIGGNWTSYHSGLAAILSDKRTVPIGYFGGAAERLLQEIQKLGPVSRMARYAPELAMLNNPWSEALIEPAIKALGLKDFPRLMIIHGRSRDQYAVRDLLREIDRNIPDPVIMGEEYGVGKSLPVKFEQLADRVDGAIAVITPDDLGGLAIDSEGRPIDASCCKFVPRARQNVWLEVGWFWGGLGLDRLLLLHRGGSDLDRPSDLQGVEYIPYHEDVGEAEGAIRRFIEELKSPGGTPA